MPTAAELVGTGFKPEHYKAEDVGVWPEAWPAFVVYMQLQNQWRCGPSGPLGLDYGVVFDLLRSQGVEGEDREELMSYLRIIESAALTKLTGG